MGGCDDVAPEDLLRALLGMSMMGKEPGWEANVMRPLDIFIDGFIKYEE